MPKVRDLGINTIPATMRPLENQPGTPPKPGPNCAPPSPPPPPKPGGITLGDDDVAELRRQLNDLL
jgi:hypothetical protein